MCSLIEAIENANADVTHADCPPGDIGADTITLPAGSTHTLTAVNNATYGPTGLPVISTKITIAGNGGTIARAGNAAASFRLLAVNASGDLTVNATTVTGGARMGTAKDGTGIANHGGTLTLTNATVSGNTSVDGNGGGVHNKLGGTLTLTNSTVSGNSAGYGGGLSRPRVV